MGIRLKGIQQWKEFNAKNKSLTKFDPRIRDIYYQSSHICSVDQEIGRESMAAYDVIFTAGFWIRKNPGLPLLWNVPIRALTLKDVELNLALKSEE